MVEIFQVEFDDKSYVIVQMSRKNQKVKAKYFAGRGEDESVYNRYKKWSNDKNIIVTTNGAYTDGGNRPRPVGLTVDQGITLNRSFDQNLGGLIVNYPAGGIIAFDINEDMSISRSGKGFESYNISNSWDRSRFIQHCEEEGLTVFQTHLLVLNNEVKVFKPKPAQGLIRNVKDDF